MTERDYGRREEMANIMTVRAPEKLQKKLTESARNQGLTRNALILNILWDWVEQNNPQKYETTNVS